MEYYAVFKKSLVHDEQAVKRKIEVTVAVLMEWREVFAQWRGAGGRARQIWRTSLLQK